MKIVFGVIVFIHGLVHLFGFSRAFGLADLPQLSQSITRSVGLLWLFSALFFIMSGVLLIIKKEWWPIVAFIAVLISQLLIFKFWQDAKFGTIANVVILFVSFTAYGHFNFKKKVVKEVAELFKGSISEETHIITKKDIKNLPLIVQIWVENSGVIGKPKVSTVRLKQKGEMKIKPENSWMPFIAEQYFNISRPSFIWITKVKALPFIYMDGRDKFNGGQGDMLIRLLYLFPVVDVANNNKINLGSMQRYLAEMCWFPSAALENYITWEPVGSNSAKATMTLAQTKVFGIFTFSKEGDFKSFETQRYFGAESNSKEETWFIETIDYKHFDGVKIPNKCRVTWKLTAGDFNWLNLEITKLEFNRNSLW